MTRRLPGRRAASGAAPRAALLLGILCWCAVSVAAEPAERQPGQPQQPQSLVQPQPRIPFPPPPAHADLASEILALQDRWRFMGGIEPGDTLTYRICDAGPAAICFDARLAFVSRQGGGDGDDTGGGETSWLVDARVTDLLGHHVDVEPGTEWKLPAVTGDADRDEGGVRWLATWHPRGAAGGGGAGDGGDWDGQGAGPQPDGSRHMQLLLGETSGASQLSGRWHNTPYAGSIERTLMLLGVGIRVGDGTLLEHDPVLDVGRSWTVQRGGTDVIVSSELREYRYGGGGGGGGGGGTGTGGIALSGPGLYAVGYVSDGPVMEAVVHADMPFPLAGTVTAGRDALRDDPHVPDRFWFRLVAADPPPPGAAGDPGAVAAVPAAAAGGPPA